MNLIAEQALTTPDPSPLQSLCLNAAEYLLSANPHLNRADERRVFKFLVGFAAGHTREEIPFDPYASKSVGIVVNLIVDIWNYKIGARK